MADFPSTNITRLRADSLHICWLMRMLGIEKLSIKSDFNSILYSINILYTIKEKNTKNNKKASQPFHKFWDIIMCESCRADSIPTESGKKYEVLNCYHWDWSLPMNKLSLQSITIPIPPLCGLSKQKILFLFIFTISLSYSSPLSALKLCQQWCLSLGPVFSSVEQSVASLFSWSRAEAELGRSSPENKNIMNSQHGADFISNSLKHLKESFH